MSCIKINNKRDYTLVWLMGFGYMFSTTGNRKMIKLNRTYTLDFTVEGFSIKQIRGMFNKLKVYDLNKETCPNVFTNMIEEHLNEK